MYKTSACTGGSRSPVLPVQNQKLDFQRHVDIDRRLFFIFNFMSISIAVFFLFSTSCQYRSPSFFYFQCHVDIDRRLFFYIHVQWFGVRGDCSFCFCCCLHIGDIVDHYCVNFLFIKIASFFPPKEFNRTKLLKIGLKIQIKKLWF